MNLANASMVSANKQVAVLTLRLILGFIFLMQGAGKVFKRGIENLYNMEFFHGTFKDLLPDFLVYGTAFYTSYVELIGGLLLVVGFKTNYALYGLASVLAIVTFGHGLAEPIWDLSHVLYRTILLMALLIIPRDWDRFSLDNLLQKKSKPIGC